MSLTCDECNRALAPTDMLYTTFGTAHDDQNLDYCAPCIEASTSPRPPLTMMTAGNRAGANQIQNSAVKKQSAPPDSLGGNPVL